MKQQYPTTITDEVREQTKSISTDELLDDLSKTKTDLVNFETEKLAYDLLADPRQGRPDARMNALRASNAKHNAEKALRLIGFLSMLIQDRRDREEQRST